MPFVSEKQRRLFWAAKHSAAMRKKHKMSKKDVDKMVEHDTGGKLPKVSKATKRAIRSSY